MVKILSEKEQQKIHQITEEAEAKTNAHIVTIILPASDSYIHYLMLFGFSIASLIDLILWHEKILSAFPYLLSIQLISAILSPFIPGIRYLTLKLLPKNILHHRAAQVAAEKRLMVTKNVDAKKPVLLIFISLAEHYIHIFPNTAIRDKIPNKEWDHLLKDLINSIPKVSLTDACVKTINKSKEILITYFGENIS